MRLLISGLAICALAGSLTLGGRGDAHVQHSAAMSVSQYGLTVTASAVKVASPFCAGMTPRRFQSLPPQQKSAALACDAPKGLVVISEGGRAVFSERLSQLNWVDFIRIADVKPHPAVIVGYASCGGSCAHIVRAYLFDTVNPSRGYNATDVFQQVAQNVLSQSATPDTTFQRILAVTASGHDHFGHGLFVVKSVSCGPSHLSVIDASRPPLVGDYIRGSGWDEPNAPLNFVYAKPSEYHSLAISCE